MLIKELFGQHLAKVAIDRKLAKSIYGFQVRYIMKNESHAEFFGSALIGVVDVHFTDALVNEFFNSILRIEQSAIVDEYAEAPAITPTFKITGDVFNLTLFYLIHAFLSNKKLPPKTINRAVFDLLLIFNYRSISALHSKGFKYLGSVELATATLEALSDRYILKQLGSWKKYMEYRAESVMDNRKKIATMTRMTDDIAFLKIIADAHNRIKSTWLLIYGLRVDIMASGMVLTSTDIHDTLSDNGGILDVTDGIGPAIEKIISRLNSFPNIYDERAVVVITQMVSKVSEKDIRQLLKDVVTYANGKHHKQVVGFVRNILSMIHSGVMSSKLSDAEKNDLAVSLSHARGLLTTSRSTDKVLLSLRDEGYSIVKESTGVSSKQQIIRLRLALGLYLYLLTRIK